MSESKSASWPEVWCDRVVSTQDEAAARVSRGDMGPLWIAARDQTGGRGRMGRVWRSCPGNLYASALFSPPGDMKPPYIGMSAGLAVLDAVHACGVVGEARLKWPNDIVVGEGKLAGVLVETGVRGGRYWAVVGIGINVVSAPVVDRPTVALSDLRCVVPDAQGVLGHLKEAFCHRLQRYVDGGCGAISARWHSVSDGGEDEALVRCF